MTTIGDCVHLGHDPQTKENSTDFSQLCPISKGGTCGPAIDACRALRDDKPVDEFGLKYAKVPAAAQKGPLAELLA